MIKLNYNFKELIMFGTKQILFLIKHIRNVSVTSELCGTTIPKRQLHLSLVRISENKNQANNRKQVTTKIGFQKVQDKTKNTYLDVIRIFIGRDVHRREHCEFIYSALKSMKEFGVHKDLEVYKALIDVLPKGKFVAQNFLQAEYMHYPKQQQCAIDILDQMEDNGVYR